MLLSVVAVVIVDTTHSPKRKRDTYSNANYYYLQNKTEVPKEVKTEGFFILKISVNWKPRLNWQENLLQNSNWTYAAVKVDLNNDVKSGEN